MKAPAPRKRARDAETEDETSDEDDKVTAKHHKKGAKKAAPTTKSAKVNSSGEECRKSTKPSPKKKDEPGKEADSNPAANAKAKGKVASRNSKRQSADNSDSGHGIRSEERDPVPLRFTQADLQKANALEYKDAKSPTLSNPIHPIWAKEHFAFIFKDELGGGDDVKTGIDRDGAAIT